MCLLVLKRVNNMKLSEQLKQDNESGDFGRALEGYEARAKALEDIVWKCFYDDACRWGATHAKAKEFADNRLLEN